MTIYSSSYDTAWSANSSIVVENDDLRLEVLPQYGGKIASLKSKADDIEWLLPPQQPYAGFDSTDAFSSSDLGGFDECFPSVSACTDSAGHRIPDHGDLWGVPWQVAETKNALTLDAEATSVPACLRRRITLHGSEARLHYTVKNTGDSDVSFLYAAHPLLRIEEGDIIVLPRTIETVRLESWSLDNQAKGSVLPWPRANAAGVVYDLSKVPRRDGTTAIKLFAGPLPFGRVGLYRPSSGRGIAIDFTAETLRFVGMWICGGAWPPEHAPSGHYTVALEPTNSPFDSKREADEHGASMRLPAGSSIEWTISLSIGSFKDAEAFQRRIDIHDGGRPMQAAKIDALSNVIGLLG